MDYNILSSIRTARGFNRSVALLVILALLGLMLERVIYYTLNDNGVIEDENPVERIQRMAPQQARMLGLRKPADYKPAPLSPESRFSHSVQDIKEKLAFMDVDYRKTNIDQLAGEINDIRQTLLSLDKGVRADFAKTAEHIRQHKLPTVIQQRQADAVAHYEKNFTLMMDKLAAVDQATTPEAKKAKLEEAKEYLSRQQFKRSQQAFDPNNLPFNSVKPNRDNKPRIHEKDFAAAGLFNNPQQKLAALGDFTFDALPGATDPAYLAETDEVVITQAIRDQAQALNYDPVQIYHWVLNNIEWLPTWGSIQDSDITLGSKKGNAMDIASLLIALLRASKIPARYVHGTIDVPEANFRNWAGGFASVEAAMDFASSGGIPITGILSGGKVTKVRMEHIWVEAAIDYSPSRGARNIDADSWVQMDGSYKQYEILQGLDVAQTTQVNIESLEGDFVTSGTINGDENWASDFNSTILANGQNLAKTETESYISNAFVDPTVGDIIGGIRTIIKQHPVLPSSLQNHIVVTGKRYGAVPSLLQQKMVFSIGRDVLGFPINPVSIPWVKLNNHKVTLSFNLATEEDKQVLVSLFPEGGVTDIAQIPDSFPAYLINVVPELKVDGEIVMAGSAIALGTEIDFNFDTQLINRAVISKTYSLPSGSFLFIAAIAGSVSGVVLDQVNDKLTEDQARLESSDPVVTGGLTRENLFGNMFQAGSLGYYSQYIALSRLAGIQSGYHHILAGGLGSFGYEPKVTYFFGVPRTLQQGGIALNKPIVNMVATNDRNLQQKRAFATQIGVISSALESSIPEQMYSGPVDSIGGVSAVVAIQRALQQGQKVYHITGENQLLTLSNIHHDPQTMDEIRNAVTSGKEVFVHENPVAFSGWNGAGYIVYDSETGAGAYKISGGGNGDYTDGIVDKGFMLSDRYNDIKGLLDVLKDQSPIGQISSLLKLTKSFVSKLTKLVVKEGVQAADRYCLTGSQATGIKTSLDLLGKLSSATRYAPGAGNVATIGVMISYMYIFDTIIHFIKINKALDECN